VIFDRLTHIYASAVAEVDNFRLSLPLVGVLSLIRIVNFDIT
jgi:hypothetical protein